MAEGFKLNMRCAADLAGKFAHHQLPLSNRVGWFSCCRRLLDECCPHGIAQVTPDHLIPGVDECRKPLLGIAMLGVGAQCGDGI